jgi:Tol biopolymer transport system component
LQAISLPPANQPPSDTASGTSLHPVVSGDGRYVAFESSAPNLVAGQTGAAELNVFLRDQTSGQVTLVSHVPGNPSAASTSGRDSYRPLLSRDGRYVVYNTVAPELEGPPPFDFVNTYINVMVYDRVTGESTLVSHSNASATTGADRPSEADAISADGRYIVFHSAATDLVPGQLTTPPGTGDPFEQLFVYDQVAKTTALVSHSAGAANTTADGPVTAFGASVADDGTVAYVSRADDLVTPATIRGDPNVYLYSPGTQANQLVSTVSGSTTAGAGGAGTRAAVSGDGSTVVYTSTAANLVAGETNPAGVLNVYRYNRSAGTALVSGAAGSATASGDADSGAFGYGAAVSRDGRFVAFASRADDLVAGQAGQVGNVFLYDASGPTLALVSGVGNSSQVGAGGVPDLDPSGIAYSDLNLLTDPASGVLSISDDGSLVAYLSDANDIVPGEANPTPTVQAFLYRQATGTSALVSAHAGSGTTAGDSGAGQPVLNGDGSLLTFPSLASDLLPAGTFDGNGSADVFTFAPAGGGAALVSRAAFQVQTPGDSFSTSVSADGRYTVFTSTATNLIPNQVTANANENVFLFDKETGAVSLVNHVPGLFNTTGDGGVRIDENRRLTGRPPNFLRPVISADGRFVAFASFDINLVPGERFEGGGRVPTPSVYLYNVQTRDVTLVTHRPGEPEVVDESHSMNPVISGDGRFVAYVSMAYGDIHGSTVLYDRLADTATPLNDVSSRPGPSSNPSISDDGRFVAYEDEDNVHVFDRSSLSTSLVSHASGSLTAPADGTSADPVVSHDGTAIAFVSAATDLVPGQDASSFTNVFLYRNDGSGAVRLVSGVLGSATAGGDGNSDTPALGLDGSTVAYRSDATDLATGQTGPTGNVFEFNAQAGTQTLVSHQTGSPAAAAGGSPAPDADFPGQFPALGAVAIDDDGHLVSYTSTAGNLIPGQSGAAGVKNVFVWLRQTNANILASGQNGSPTAGGDADSDFPLLTRDSFPGFSSRARNLLSGLAGRSVAYINTLVAVSLSPNTFAGGSAPGSVVGSLSVTSLLVGQFLPPVYNLPGAEADNGLFGLSGAALLAGSQPAAPGTYTVRLHVNVGFGDSPVLLQVFAVPGPAGEAPHPLAAALVSVRGGRHKARRLRVAVFDLVSGAQVKSFASPFQVPTYRAISLTPLGGGSFRLSARKGKRPVSILLHL